jgi:hypothetical protein
MKRQIIKTTACINCKSSPNSEGTVTENSWRNNIVSILTIVKFKMNVGNTDCMMWRKLNDFFLLSSHSTTESHPDSRSLLTKIPNIQDKFCVDNYTNL